MKITPYIVLNGNTAEAIDFYVKALNATVLGLMKFSDAPGHSDVPEEMKSLVMHAMIEFDGNRLMFSDNMPHMPFQLGDQLSIAISSTNTERLKKMYHSLAEGGKVHMELQETFWSPAFAMVTDKFGITWQISGEAEQQG